MLSMKASPIQLRHFYGFKGAVCGSRLCGDDTNGESMFVATGASVRSFLKHSKCPTSEALEDHLILYG